MLRTYGFLDTQGRLLSRCCGCLSPIYGVGSTAYRVWSVSPPDSLLHLPQRECCTVQLFCMAPPKKSNREELDDSAEATSSSNTSELEGQIYGACNKRQRRWAVPRRVQSTPRAPHWRKRTPDGCTGLPGPILLRVCVATGPVTSPHTSQHSDGSPES